EIPRDPLEAQQRRVADRGEQRLGLGTCQIRDRMRMGHEHLLGFIPPPSGCDNRILFYRKELTAGKLHFHCSIPQKSVKVVEKASGPRQIRKSAGTRLGIAGPDWRRFRLLTGSPAGGYRSAARKPRRREADSSRPCRRLRSRSCRTAY